MFCVSCILRKISYVQDEIGVSKEIVTEKEVPITKIEKIYGKEFYKAHEVGFKPRLRIRINILSYNDESELIYNSETYTVVRTQEANFDEIILICERKIKNV